MKNPNALLMVGLTLGVSAPALAETPDNGTVEQYLVHGEDAEALFVRLQKKEYIFDGKNEVHTKIGQNVTCTMNSSIRRQKTYECAFSVRLPKGELHEAFPIGEDDPGEGLRRKPEFMGSFIQIKKGQDDAVVQITGNQAKTMYDGLTAPETDAIIRNGEIVEGETNHDKNGDHNGTSLKLKNAVHIRCFTTTDTIAQVWQCNLTINSLNGKAKPAKPASDTQPPSHQNTNSQTPVPPPTNNQDQQK